MYKIGDNPLYYDNKCRICGNEENNKIYEIRERLLNKGETFNYLYCSKCGTLQLHEKVDIIANYYPDNYYAFVPNKPRRRTYNFIRKSIGKYITDERWVLPSLLFLFLRKYLGSITYLYNTNASEKDSILDVGGGNGQWLHGLIEWGFSDLTCVDRFCKKGDFSGVKFIQSDILKMKEEKEYKIVTLHHSFEHMDNPVEVLRKIYKLLDEKGILLIRIPICDSYSWNKYHENWYQIDAPRHSFLYSVEAMELLCSYTGFAIKDIVYDSNYTQFAYSKMYRDTTYSLEEIKSKKNFNKLWLFLKAAKANKNKTGDQATFFIIKT